IEIQYFDGTVEEMDIEDWQSQWEEGALESAEAPEDWSGSVDVEGSDDEGRGGDSLGDDRDVRARPLDGIDLFESPATPSSAPAKSRWRIRPLRHGGRKCFDIHAVGEEHETAPYRQRHRCERSSGARPGDAISGGFLEERSVRGA